MSRDMNLEPTLVPESSEPATDLRDPEKGGTAAADVDLHRKIALARRSWLIIMACNFLSFWIAAVWIFGTTFKDEEHVYRLHMNVADFDGGPFGAALLAAVQSVNGRSTYPTFHVVDAAAYNPQTLEHRTFIGDNWGSIYASSGASERFAAVVANPSAAASYDASTVLYYAGVQARYVTSWASYLEPALETIADTAAKMFLTTTVSPLMTNGTVWSAEQARVLVDPIGSTFNNLAPLPFGGRVFVNTVGQVFPVLIPFFALLARKITFDFQQGLKLRSSFQDVHIRLGFVLAYSLIGSLSIVSWLVMFDETYNIKAKNFFAVWAIRWVNLLINHTWFQTIIVVIGDPFWMPPIVLLTAILSVASCVYPIELQNRFYRIQYAFPAHAAWQSEITIWGNGAADKLYYNLPILAAWLILGGVMMGLTLRIRTAHLRSPNRLTA